MNITTATPVEIDTRLADLHTKATEIEITKESVVGRLHLAVGDRQRYVGRQQVWGMADHDVILKAAEKVQAAKLPQDTYVMGMDVNKLVAAVVTANYSLIPVEQEITRLNAEYRRRGGWVRFFQLRSTANAHIHDRQDCPGLYRSNLADLGWNPELSGTDAKTAVAKLGPTLCSKCYPDAPVEWRRDPAEMNVDPNRCPGSEQRPVDGTIKLDRSTVRGGMYGEYGKCTGCGENRSLRRDCTVGKHKKPVVKTNEVTAADGQNPLKVKTASGLTETVKTVRTAQIMYVEDAAYVIACDNGFEYRNRYAEAKAVTEALLEAMARAKDTTPDALRAELAKKVTARVKRDYPDFQ